MRFFFNWVFGLSKNIKFFSLLTTDFLLFYSSFICSYFLISHNFSNHSYESLIIISAMFATVKLLFCLYYKMYNFLWRYASVTEFLSIIKSSLFSSLILGSSIFFFFNIHIHISIFILDFLLTVFLIVSLRVLLRLIRDYSKHDIISQQKKRVLIIGAGEIASRLAREIVQVKSLPYDIIGFLDDDKKKHGQLIQHKKILGPINQLSVYCNQFTPDEVIIAIPSASKKFFSKVYSLCKKTNIPFKSTPSFQNFIHQKTITQQLKHVDIEDLLFRSEIKKDISFFSRFYNDKTILITGAGGSIGSEICKQLLLHSNSKLLILDHHENSLFELTQNYSLKYKNRIIPLVTDIKDFQGLDSKFSTYKPEIVLHAAAHKHVPLMESNVYDVIKNNINGSENLYKIAGKHSCSHVLLISSDKAVRPSSCMGASKRVCEMLIQIYSNYYPNTCYSAVRFGNVLGSNGSVIPLFKKQIKNGGPLTVTDPKMTRYFMTIPEAVYLVLQSISIAKSKDIFILDMGQPIKILDLAKQMITLSGLVLNEDIEINFIGTRPGEKLYEELYINPKLCKKTSCKKIFIKKHFRFDQELVKKAIEDLCDIPLNYSEAELKKKIFNIANNFIL